MDIWLCIQEIVQWLDVGEHFPSLARYDFKFAMQNLFMFQDSVEYSQSDILVVRPHIHLTWSVVSQLQKLALFTALIQSLNKIIQTINPSTLIKSPKQNASTYQ